MIFEFGELPPQMQAMMQQQQNMRMLTQMQMDDFFSRQAPEDLVTLRGILDAASSSDEMLGMFKGFIYWQLKQNGLCQHCGKDDHAISALEDEANQGIGEVPGQMTTDEAVEPVAAEEMTVNGFTLSEVSAMMEYRIDDLRDEETNELLGFICVDCGYRYPSIEDRMLKPPSDCPGCFLKAAHG